jgi:hypothetical protein
MKNIEAVSIWDKGTVRQAKILNSYAVNVTLNTSATFWYGLFAENEDTSQGAQLAAGNLNMTGEAYTQWQSDNYAWDWIAGQLNLTITGEYVPPVPPEPTPIVEETVVVEEPIV